MATIDTQATSMSEALRLAIVASGISYKSLAERTGVQRSSIQRFVDARQSIRLDRADALAAFLGLSLRQEGE